LFFDPASVDSIAEALRRLLKDADQRADLRARGMRQASRFSWQETARQTWGVYQAVQAHGVTQSEC
jgi:glycosyltransferase involved in cell wall biosynthesis